jgi:hypothetical protein
VCETLSKEKEKEKEKAKEKLIKKWKNSFSGISASLRCVTGQQQQQQR